VKLFFFNSFCPLDGWMNGLMDETHLSFRFGKLEDSIFHGVLKIIIIFNSLQLDIKTTTEGCQQLPNQ